MLIKNYANVNQFSYVEQWKIRAGDPNTLYFQLVDEDQDNLRYMAGIGGTNQPYSVVVTCPSIDNSKILQFLAVQSDLADSSIWQIQIASTQIPNSGNVVFMVSEGPNLRTFQVVNAMHVELPGASGAC